MPHRLRRRRRDRLTLNMAVIDRRRLKLDGLPDDLQVLVNRIEGEVTDLLDLRGMDTDDRTDLYLIGLGATLLQQTWQKADNDLVRELAYEIVMDVVCRRLAAVSK